MNKTRILSIDYTKITLQFLLSYMYVISVTNYLHRQMTMIRSVITSSSSSSPATAIPTTASAPTQCVVYKSQESTNTSSIRSNNVTTKLRLYNAFFKNSYHQTNQLFHKAAAIP